MLSIIQKSSTAPTVMKAFLQNGIFSASTGANKNPPSVSELFQLKNQDAWLVTPPMIPNLKADDFFIPKNQRLEPKIEGGWKIVFPFHFGVILRFQPLIFRSVTQLQNIYFLIHPGVSTTFQLSKMAELCSHIKAKLWSPWFHDVEKNPCQINRSLKSPWKTNTWTIHGRNLRRTLVEVGILLSAIICVFFPTCPFCWDLSLNFQWQQKISPRWQWREGRAHRSPGFWLLQPDPWLASWPVISFFRSLVQDCVHIYIYVYIFVCIYIYIYYIWRGGQVYILEEINFIYQWTKHEVAVDWLLVCYFSLADLFQAKPPLHIVRCHHLHWTVSVGG